MPTTRQRNAALGSTRAKARGWGLGTRSVEISAGWPRDDGHAPVRLVGKARGPRCGGLQQRPTMSLQGPAEIASATFDPDSDYVEDLPGLDVAEVDGWARLTTPSHPSGACLRGGVGQFLLCRLPR